MMGDAGVPNESLAGSLFVEVTSLVEQELFSSAVTLGQYMVASAGGASAPPSCKALLADALFGALRAASFSASITGCSRFVPETPSTNRFSGAKPRTRWWFPV